MALPYDEARARVARNLRKLREERGWSVRKAAFKVGVSHPTIFRYESEDSPHDIRFDNLLKFASAYGVTVDDLLDLGASETVRCPTCRGSGEIPMRAEAAS